MSRYCVYRCPAGYDLVMDPNANPAWEAFIRERVGPHVVDAGCPTFEDAMVAGTSGSPTKLGGYSVIDGKDPDAALALTDACLVLAKGGSVEVGIFDLPAEHPAEVLRSERAGQ
jgi:hypothetical protein